MDWSSAGAMCAGAAGRGQIFFKFVFFAIRIAPTRKSQNNDRHILFHALPAHRFIHIIAESVNKIKENISTCIKLRKKKYSLILKV